MIKINARSPFYLDVDAEVNIEPPTQQTQTINQTTTTSPVIVSSTQTTIQPTTNNASGTGTSYSY